MEWLKLLLRVASLALPRPYRDRWTEEALAVLCEVDGWRRWWYAVDTALKAPLLAREYQRGPVLRPRWLLSFAGAGLVAGPVLTFGAIFLGASADAPLIVATLSMSLGLLPTVGARSFHVAARRGGGVHHLRAAAVTAAVVLGPVATIRAAAVERADWTILGMVLLGAWLVGVNLRIVRGRAGATDQAVLGVMSGVPLLVLPVAALLGGPIANSLVFFGFGLAVPVLAIWCVLAGLRMVAGRPDLIVASDAGGTDRGVEVGR